MPSLVKTLCRWYSTVRGPMNSWAAMSGLDRPSPAFPRPADLGEIIACSLDGFGPAARAVTVDFPPDLPQVMADPPIMERIIVNLAGNALRYSPAGSPLLLTAG